MNITLQQLEFFRAVARNMSFSNAARELYTSQPYVSNQIRRLEEQFGVPLFIRAHPRISLTDTGAAMFERIEQILADVEQLEELVQEFQGLRRGTVKIAATASAGNHVMPELIARFQFSHPDVVVNLRVGNTDEVLELLDRREIEIGVLPRNPDISNMRSDQFYREALIVIHPADMELPDPIGVEELSTLPKVVREAGSLTRARMHELLDEYPTGHAFVAQLSGTTAVNEAVAAGLGVSLVPERSAKAWLDSGAVHQCAVADVDLYHDFNIFYSEQRYLTPAAQALVDHLLASIPLPALRFQEP